MGHQSLLYLFLWSHRRLYSKSVELVFCQIITFDSEEHLMSDTSGCRTLNVDFTNFTLYLQVLKSRLLYKVYKK